MLFRLTVCVLICTLSISAYEPDDERTTEELINTKGYIYEEHKLTTKDGYILQLHRIPCGLKNNKDKSIEKRPSVLIQHGIMDSSADFVLNSAKQSLGFILADAGFDVWLGNSRGNVYSNRHVKYNVSQEKYWNFTFSEISQYDLPAMIDHILTIKNESDLIYIGHSQGTMIGFAGLSDGNIELAKKIKLFIALSPVATLGYMEHNSLIKQLARIAIGPNENLLYDIIGKKGFTYDNPLIKQAINLTCNFNPTKELVCTNFLFALCGPSKHLNHTRLPVYLLHTPAGSSVKNFFHYAQLTQIHKFQKFDYGEIGNMIAYNQSVPLEYNLSGINVPTALFSGGEDWLADLEDIKFVRNNLKNIIVDVFIKDYDHLDFIWGLNAKDILYPKIVEIMKKFQNK